MYAGEIQSVDIRLPLAANQLGVTAEGQRKPFAFLHAVADCFQEIPEMNEGNNGAVMAREQILHADPKAFSADRTVAAPGSLLTLACEAIGPDPGQVIVMVNGQQQQAVIHGWCDRGVNFAMPNFTLTGPVDAEFLVVRGDGIVTNTVMVQLVPASMLVAAAAIPEAAPIPSPQQ